MVVRGYQRVSHSLSGGCSLDDLFSETLISGPQMKGDTPVVI